MTVLSPNRFEYCVQQAARAPSPHNVQPARWRLEGDRVELWEDATRWLPASDSMGRDNRIALGMAWEGMSLALSALGFELKLNPGAHATNPYPPDAHLRRIASGQIVPGAVADPLAAYVGDRACYRLRFAPINQPKANELLACLQQHHAVAVALPPDAIDEVARLYDIAAAKGLADEASARELYAWMRFSPADPRACEDGLSAECMGLSRWEAAGAAILLRPGVLRLLRALRLHGMLVSERAKVRSAAAIVLIHKPHAVDVFDAGRAWYRLWLDLERAGFGGVPMSAIVDDPDTARQLGARWPVVPASNTLINLMRVGVRGEPAPMSSRLPPQRLVLPTTVA